MTPLFVTGDSISSLNQVFGPIRKFRLSLACIFNQKVYFCVKILKSLLL